MKTRFLTLLAATSLLFASCSDDDKAPNNDWVPENLKTAFDQKFAGNSIQGNQKWEMETVLGQSVYKVEFWEKMSNNNYERDAYFSKGAAWLGTKTELDRSKLQDALVPQAVREAFNATEYKTWKLDDVDLLEIADNEDLFMIEVEQGKQELHLFFNREGKQVQYTPGMPEGQVSVSEATKSKFTKDFEATIVPEFGVKWSNKVEKGETYKVAKFKRYVGKKKYEVEAWYDNKGNWFMTETEVERTNIDDAIIPDAVRKSYNELVKDAKYAGWNLDEIEKVERAGAETIYILELKNGKKEQKLIFSETGVLFNKPTIEEGNNNNGHNGGLLPNAMPAAIKGDLDTRFAGYKFIEIDTELDKATGKSYYEVEIFHDKKKKEVIYTVQDTKWVQTKWEIEPKYGDVYPVAIVAAVAKDFAGWRLEDMDCVVDVKGTHYLVELEKKGQPDKKVKYTEDGKQIK